MTSFHHNITKWTPPLPADALHPAPTTHLRFVNGQLQQLWEYYTPDGDHPSAPPDHHEEWFTIPGQTPPIVTQYPTDITATLTGHPRRIHTFRAHTLFAPK